MTTPNLLDPASIDNLAHAAWLNNGESGSDTTHTTSDTSLGGVRSIWQRITVANDNLPRVLSALVPKALVAPSFYPAMDIRGLVDNASVCIDTVHGTLTERPGYEPYTSGCLDFSDEFWLVYVSYREATTLFLPMLSPAYNANATGVPGVAAIGTGTFRDVVYELGDLPSRAASPVAEFIYTPASGELPLAVVFQNTSAGDPNTYLWDLGDGNISTDENPIHIYDVAGTYTVTLTVYNWISDETLVVEDAITVSGARSTPRFAYENLFEDDAATVSVSSEDDGFEKENAYDWNPTTFWKPTAGGDQWMAASFSSAQPVNYIAFFAHNIGTNGGTVQLQYSTDGGSTWLDALTPITPLSTECFYRRFTQRMAADWRVVVTSVDPCALGLLSIGVDFALEHGDWKGFSPPVYNRDTQVTNVTSEGGVLLGRSIIAQGSKMAVNPEFMSEAFAEATWLPFMEHAELKPFFFLWNPDDKPAEASFCWTDKKITGPAYTSVDYLQTGITAQARNR